MAVKGKHGALLAGRYRLLEQLGEGGMGSVWKAEHLSLHSHVAIKIIDPEVARLEFNLARFLREAKTLATLRSPNVVQVLDFGSDADTPYLVMEMLEGQTLGRRLSDKGRMSLGETSRVLHDVCLAMALVHEQGLIHRDLKPDNIFLCDSGGRRVTKVVDFGIAKSMRGDMSASMQTRTGHMLGTPSYMSPEQCRGLKDIDHRADLWALGVIAYECLVGKVPFEGEVLGDLLLRICMDPLPIPSQQARGVLPSAFDAWFAKAVARDRGARFQSASELATALAALSPAIALGATLSGRESADASRPSFPRLATPVSTPRQPPNTETNTTIGLAGGFGRRADRRARLLALTAVGAVAALGLWALGTKRDADGATNVDVQPLKAPYEVTPKVIRPSVPSGRRWQTAPFGGAGGEPQRSVRPADGDSPGSPNAVDPATIKAAPSPSPDTASPAGAAGTESSGANSAPAETHAPETPPSVAVEAPGEVVSDPVQQTAAEATPPAAPDRLALPIRPLRGTSATPPPSGSRAVKPNDTAIRRSR